VNDPEPQHYSVQFNETDFAYLTRRLEEDGIFHWFAHEGGAMGSVAATHTLHISSDISGYTSGDETDIRFAMGSSDRNHINKFEKRFRFVPGKRSAADWNFLTPGGPAEGNTPSLVKLPKNEDYDLYEYPMIGGYGTESASEAIDNKRVEAQSRLRMQAAEVEHERIEGLSNVRTLAPARRFKPYDVANPSNIFEEHIILEIVHTARDRSYETNAGDPEYNNAFTAIPSRVPATPHRVTPRPRIDGTQIAIVAGPEGEEIHPDEYGRIKLWFPWDRKAKKDGSDTCWVRVTQNWAGAGWGGQIIPRIGMEVMVMYLDGDPDRPVVTGVVPNPKQKVPYPLPANKTRSVFKTKTHKGRGFNELYFEDEADAEEIYMHAQKDMNVDILHNRAKTVGNDQSEDVGRDKTISVGHDHTERIGSNKTLSVGESFGRTVGRVSTEQVGMLKSTFVGGDQTVMVGENKNENVGKSLSYSAGENIGFDAGKVFEIKATDTFRVKVGEARFEMDKSGIIVIEAPLTTIAKGAATQLTIGPGPVLYTPALVPGKTPPPPAQCLKKLAAQRVPFIKPRSNA
jgi:type VI secretion system secreted protein VgrG